MSSRVPSELLGEPQSAPALLILGAGSGSKHPASIEVY